MNLVQLHYMRGPNVWAVCPVLEGVLDFGDERHWSSEEIREALERLQADLPDFRSASSDHDNPALADLAQAFIGLVRKLQDLAGNPVSFATVRTTSRPALFLTAVEFAEDC